MKSKVAILITLFVMSGHYVTVNQSKADSTKFEYAPGELVVKFKAGADRSRSHMQGLYSTLQVSSVKRSNFLIKELEFWNVRSETLAQKAIEYLKRSADVEYVHRNVIFRVTPIIDKNNLTAGRSSAIPCIPGFEIPGCDPKACWIPGFPFPPGCESGSTPGEKDPELKPVPEEPKAPVVDKAFDTAWGIGKIQTGKVFEKGFFGDRTFIVADIDTGIDYNHEDLANNVWRNPNPEKDDLVGYDFVHSDGLPFDDQSHGSHTAGSIGATYGNGIGISGVSGRVSIMSLKFLNDQGSGKLSDAVLAIDYAIEHGARVLSNSWGGQAPEAEVKALGEAVERARQKGVLFVAAAGNGDRFGNGLDIDKTNNLTYPASFMHDNMITVLATDNADKLAKFSNYGLTRTHLAAPGVDVVSTTPNNKYEKMSGTSMACPHVAGAASLLWAKKPTMTYLELKSLMLDSVDPIAGLKGKTATGGRLNVSTAFSKL